jgi:L-lactate dehydrogenase
MVPIWSSAAVNGLPLTKWPGLNPNMQNQIFDRTKKSGAEVIQRKGGAGWAVGLAIREVVDAIALNQRRVLPISSRQNGAYGAMRTCFSVPTIVDRRGIVQRLEIELWPKERTAMQASARALDETYAKVSV